MNDTGAEAKLLPLSQHLDLHIEQARGKAADAAEGGLGQVNHPATHKGAAVVDAHHHALAVGGIGHLDHRAEGQFFVRGSGQIMPIRLATGGAPILKFISIKRRFAGLMVAGPVTCRARGHRAAAGQNNKECEQRQNFHMYTLNEFARLQPWIAKPAVAAVDLLVATALCTEQPGTEQPDSELNHRPRNQATVPPYTQLSE